MDSGVSRRTGWLGFSAIVLLFGGVFATIDGLVAVYRSTFFIENAVYVFSDLNTWGWIVFGLGVAGVISGLAVLSGREWARWLGVTVAFVGALGQLMFAQAYPVWSLALTAVYFLAIYGLLAYGGSERATLSASSHDEVAGAGGSSGVSDLSERSRRAA